MQARTELKNLVKTLLQCLCCLKGKRIWRGLATEVKIQFAG